MKNFIPLSTILALAFLVLIWLLNRILVKKSIFDYIYGQDGRPSTSKFQFFVFTFAFVFSFAVLHIYLWYVTGFFRLIDGVPQNILIAMGFSCVTFVGAKAITTSNLSAGKIVKQTLTGKTNWMSLVCDDNDNLDFSKFQMLIWTLVAVLVFIFQTYGIIDDIKIKPLPPDYVKHHIDAVTGNYTFEMPDISTSLMVLMGLGQGTYLGKKLIIAPIPVLTAIIVVKPASSGAVNPELTIQGGDFGNTRGNNQVLIDGIALGQAAVISVWSANAITFNPGPNHPNGHPFTVGQVIQISVLINGFNSSNSLAFTF
jgi:hypothetical protein